MKRSSKFGVVVERTAWVSGSALLLAYATAQWRFSSSRETGLQEFAIAHEQRAGEVGTLGASERSEDQQRTAKVLASHLQSQIEPPVPLRAAAPDTTSWSPARITAYQAEDSSAAPQGVLRIRSIALEVPIYAGATESNLNRGAAWIEATAPLGAPGNTGLASHRDGYFRALRDIALGDRIELRTLQQTQVYTVDDIRVVDPAEVHVLAPTSDERLTLVTCHPFFMVGPAPKRFVVRARLAMPQDAS